MPDLVDQPVQAIADLEGVAPLAFHQQHRLGLTGNENIESWFGLAHQAQMAAVHQVARAGLVGHDFQNRARRPIQAVEQQQRHAAIARQFHGPQGGFRHQSQRPFRTDQQPRQVQMAVVDEIGQVVAAAAVQAVGLVSLDECRAAGKHVGRPQDQLALAGSAVVGAIHGDRLATDLH